MGIFSKNFKMYSFPPLKDGKWCYDYDDKISQDLCINSGKACSGAIDININNMKYYIDNDEMLKICKFFVEIIDWKKYESSTCSNYVNFTNLLREILPENYQEIDIKVKLTDEK